MLFFGALFFGYAIARAQSPDAFAAASRHTNLLLGTHNTAVLLTSSLTMALAVTQRALQAAQGDGDPARCSRRCSASRSSRSSSPNTRSITATISCRCSTSPSTGAASSGARSSSGFYFATTGSAPACTCRSASRSCSASRGVAHRRGIAGTRRSRVEIAGLYWHFVDLVWIFLYPCLYLVART